MTVSLNNQSINTQNPKPAQAQQAQPKQNGIFSVVINFAKAKADSTLNLITGKNPLADKLARQRQAICEQINEIYEMQGESETGTRICQFS